VGPFMESCFSAGSSGGDVPPPCVGWQGNNPPIGSVLSGSLQTASNADG